MTLSVALRRLLAVAALALVVAAPAHAVSGGVVISQVYGGGGNSGATYKQDFVELFNRSSVPQSISGWSIQYASATGTGLFGSSATAITELPAVVLGPGQYFLVREAQGAGGTTDVPADHIDGTPIAMSGTDGKVALVNSTTPLGCNGGSTPCSPAALASIVDLVGYGTANFFEGAAAPGLSNTTSDFRKNGGCIDTDNNAADFQTGAPGPRNLFSSANLCPTGDTAPSVSSTTPGDGSVNVANNSNVAITFSEPVNVTGAWYSISCTASGSHTATVTGGPTTFTLDPDTNFAPSESCNVTVFAAGVSDQDALDPPDTLAADYAFGFSIAAPPPPPTTIRAIQGTSHISPKNGQAVTNVQGVITAERSTGFYMQDPNPDASDDTSEGIFVFRTGIPAASFQPGDLVSVNGTVTEFRGTRPNDLTLTEISVSTVTNITKLSSANPLPMPVVIGAGGRVPPAQNFEDDAAPNSDSLPDIEAGNDFDPAADALDFYESLEGMLVRIDDPVAVSPTAPAFGEIWVLPNDGDGAGERTAANGVIVRPGRFNARRLVLDDEVLRFGTSAAMTNVNVGAKLATVVGAMDYGFSAYRVETLAAPVQLLPGRSRETTTLLTGRNKLTVGTFNVENLTVGDAQSKFNELGRLIVDHMGAPDILALEEIQDNNGAVNDSVVDANLTLDKLVASVQGAGGPTYQYRQINPVDDQDGGQPGGNIRVGFFFRTDRGVAFVDRPGGTSTSAVGVTGTGEETHLTFSPGRVDPANAAWNASRKPLAGEFTFNGETVFVIANHFNSKGGDSPLHGRLQPPVRVTEAQRAQQATVERDFLDQLLAANPNARIVTLGDFNDFPFSDAVGILKGSNVHDLIETLPANEQYSYVFEGNSQVLDHILASDSLFATQEYDVVHVNSEFFDQASDHDPAVARFTINAAPTADAGGPYTVAEGSSVTVTASGSDVAGDPLTYAWDLDDDGTFETSGQSATFSAAAIDGPATRTIRVQVTDDGGASSIDDAAVTVTNVAPTATFNAPASVNAGFPFTLSLTNPHDPAPADTFSYAFDCGDGSGYGVFGPANTAVCPTTAPGTRSVGGKIRDDDGGVTEYRGVVDVTLTHGGLCELVQSVVTQHGIANSLCQKLENSAAAKARGNENASDNLLDAFMNEVQAQAGKKAIAEAHAALLIGLARTLQQA